MVEVFERFMEKYKAERNPAENTVKSLKGIIPKFLGYCEGLGRNELNEITPEDVIGYLNSLEGTRTSTKKVHKAFITLFMNFCFSYGFLGRRLGRIAYKGVADVPRAPLKGFTESEMSLMKRKAPKLEIRERIIFNLISNRPLRISELVHMTVGAVDLENERLAIYRSKNTTTRVLAIPKEAFRDLTEFIANRPKEESLFGIRDRMMEGIVLDMIKTLGVKPNGRGSHAFRHTVIASMLRKHKFDPAVVASIAGNTPRTIYSHYSGHVSIDEQHQAEKEFDRASKPRKKSRPDILS